MVRVELAGRRVGAWVVAVDVEPPADVELRPVAKVSGIGPDPSVVELTRWAAWRWAGRWAALLAAASPPRMVARVTPAPPARPSHGSASHGSPSYVGEALDVAAATGVVVVRIPPAAAVAPLVRAASERFGDLLVLAPTTARADRIARSMAAEGRATARMPHEWAAAAGGGRLVVGARAAAFAPAPTLGAVIVVDEHDEAYQEERAPTWHARDVALERARRAGVPIILISPCPTLEALAAGPLVTVDRQAERAGWPTLEVADLAGEDAYRTGLLSHRLASAIQQGERVVCVLNRKGRARLVACDGCGAVGHCTHCGGGVVLDDRLVCLRCGTARPVVCDRCGATRFRNLRPGIRRLRDDLAALAGEDVAEISGGDEDVPSTRVVVGTEAVLHRVGDADLVAFLDFDQELLAPRYRAAEEAMALLVRAARIVGGRSRRSDAPGARGGASGARGGRILVQTRSPDHPVLDAVRRADPGRLSEGERVRRELLRLPPAAAVAHVVGSGADTLAAELAQGIAVEVTGGDGAYLIRAPDHILLADALAAAPRPPERVRVEVDPLRL